MKLFETIISHFDDHSLGLLGAVLGEHEVKVRDGLESAAAEILGAVGNRTRSKQGREMLWRELRDTDPALASSFPNQLYYQNSQSLVENGNRQLAGMVGQNADAITARVSHAADIGSTSASRMVGAVSPLIFSSLAAWQQQEQVDAEGWQRIFASQTEGLRERAIHARTKNVAAKDRQQTFPGFDSQWSTEKQTGDQINHSAGAGQGDNAGQWTTGSGFTPGYTGSAADQFNAPASGSTCTTTVESDADRSSSGGAGITSPAAIGLAGAAAVTGIAAAGGQSASVHPNRSGQPAAQTSQTTSQTPPANVGVTSYQQRRARRQKRPAFAANPAFSSFGATAVQSGLAAAAVSPVNPDHASSPVTPSSTVRPVASTPDPDQPRRWVPDTENLRRERERTAIENARLQREARLAKEQGGGLGFLWWPLGLLTALVAGGWFYADQLRDALVVNADPVSLSTPGTGTSDQIAGAPTITEPPTRSIPQPVPDEADPALPSLPELKAADQPDIESGLDDAVKLAPAANGFPLLEPSETESATAEADAVKHAAPRDDAITFPAPPTASAADSTDVDFQVETWLTDLETALQNVKDEASAKSALPGLNEGVTALEDLLGASDQWSSTDRNLVELQMEEAATTFAKLKKTAFATTGIRTLLTPVFARLETLMADK